MKFLSFIVISVIAIVVYTIYTYKSVDHYEKEQDRLSPSQKKELYDILKRFDQVCRDYNIPYFIIGGTLLGSVRHKELIPWDYDADVGVMKEHLDRLDAADFSKYGLKTDTFILQGKGKIKLIESYNEQPVDLDVFGYTRTGEYGSRGEKIDFLFELARKAWPTEYFYEDELFPLQTTYQFGDMILPGPSEYIPYCERAWGDWKTPKRK